MRSRLGPSAMNCAMYAAGFCRARSFNAWSRSASSRCSSCCCAAAFTCCCCSAAACCCCRNRATASCCCRAWSAARLIRTVSRDLLAASSFAFAACHSGDAPSTCCSSFETAFASTISFCASAATFSFDRGTAVSARARSASAAASAAFARAYSTLSGAAASSFSFKLSHAFRASATACMAACSSGETAGWLMPPTCVAAACPSAVEVTPNKTIPTVNPLASSPRRCSNVFITPSPAPPPPVPRITLYIN